MSFSIKNPFRKKETKKAERAAEDKLDGIDDETLAIARELAFDKKLREATSREKGRGRGTHGVKLFDPQDALNRLFARDVGDTVLANRFVDRTGRRVGDGLTVRAAAAMDGLRDIDDDSFTPNVGVSTAAATPMNPEGVYELPTPRTGTGASDIYRRYNEAISPKNYADIPSDILEHFAKFATFIGYPACEVIAGHPTVSNACNIPGKDAIAVGYQIKFVDSEDMDGNGIPDDREGGNGATQKAQPSDGSTAKADAMSALNDALAAMSGENMPDGMQTDADRARAINLLAVALERVKAYAEINKALQREGVGEGEGEGAEGRRVVPELYKMLSDAFVGYAKSGSAKNVTNAQAALGIALSRLVDAKRGDEAVRNAWARRKIIADLTDALEALNKTPAKDGEVLWNPMETLNRLVIALERVNAYDYLADENKEIKAALTMAFSQLAANPQSATDKNRMIVAVSRAIAAMDSGEFKIEEEPTLDGVAKPKQEGDVTDGTGGKGTPEGGDTVAAQAMAEKLSALQEAKAQKEDAEKQEREEEDKRKQEHERKAKERQKALNQWKRRADEMGLNAICRGLARNARIFGIGIAVPIVEGGDYESEFDISKIKPNSYKGFTLIEPTWIYPEVDGNDLVNPMSKYFFEPEYWALSAAHTRGGFFVRRIHRSWMVIVRHKDVPDMLRPMYYYGGIPLTQEIYEAVYCADKVMNEVPKLAMCKRTTVVKGSPNDFITNPEGVVERLSARSQVQDNFGILYVDRNTDVTQLETSLTEFDQLITKCNQRVASIAQMPETKLFKTQLAGMNSAGRYEWDDYAQLLIDIQNNWFVPLLTFHYKLDSMSQNGKPIQVNVEFNAIEVQTSQEKEQSESTALQTITGAIQSQMITGEEGRTLLRSREDGMFSSLSADMPKELKEQAQQQQGGGMPGMTGMGGGEGGAGGDPLAALAGGGGGGTPSGSPLDEKEEPEEPKEPTERK